LNILIVNGSAQMSGGAERVALTTAIALAKSGHKVSVLAAHGPVSPELADIENLDVWVAQPNEPPPLVNVVERVKFLWPTEVAGFLRARLAEVKEAETVIHFHSGYLEFGIPGFREICNSKAPLVYTHHDYAWACPLMGFYNYRTASSCPLTGGSLACLGTDCVNSYVDKWIRFARHLGTHQTSHIGSRVAEHIFVSQTSLNKLAPYLGSGSRRTVLANPADFVKGDPAGISDGSPFVFLGRLTTEKDPVALALAAKAVGAAVRFIGDGPLFEEVKLANPDAEMVGWKSSGEVGELLAQSRALVMTSRWLEAAPLVLAEAFSRGLCAVVPSETAAAEFVEDGKNGLIYESRNSSSLEAALSRLKDLDLARKLGAEAYRRFWANPPTWEAHLNGLQEIYTRALARS
jgi:glycosyltransferase involved in cell wall biosynthesis